VSLIRALELKLENVGNRGGKTGKEFLRVFLPLDRVIKQLELLGEEEILCTLITHFYDCLSVFGSYLELDLENSSFCDENIPKISSHSFVAYTFAWNLQQFESCKNFL
jgi:hypothetical protein